MTSTISGALSGLLEVVVWWALMVGVWVITLSGTTVPEIVAAAVAGLLSAVAATVARRLIAVSGRPSARWLAWLPVLAAAIVADTARVFVVASRHLARRDVEGSFTTVWLQRPRRADADMHRALAALTVTSTPGSIVCDADPRAHCLVEHGLVDGPPDLAGAVRR